MSEFSAEKIAQRALELGLLDARQLEFIRNDLGPEATEDQFRSVVLRKELFTNYQLERLLKGERTGYFYGDYKVLYLTGTGTFARVYRSVKQDNKKVFAVKVLRKRFREDRVQMELFLREGELGMMLRHPNIVPTYEIDTDPNSPFFVMDFVEGQNLREWIKVRKKLEVPTAVGLVTDIVSGLDYAAKMGVYHRDLKLSNVLVTSRGRARLVDFGLYGTRAGEDPADVPNARTVDYVGLERATGVRKNDIRSDIYFTGCIFYHIVAGVSPLLETRDRMQRLSVSRYRDVKPLSVVDPTLPKQLCAIVQRAMELTPEKRYQTPGEMLLDLERLGAKLDSTEDTSAASASPRTRTRETTVSGPDSMEGASRTVMVVAPNVTLQNALRDNLKKYGYRVLIYGDADRAIARFEDDQQSADCIVFGSSDVGEVALEAFNRMASHAKLANIPAILLLDEEHLEYESRAMCGANRVVQKMPLKFKELRASIKTIISNQPSSAS